MLTILLINELLGYSTEVIAVRSALFALSGTFIQSDNIEKQKKPQIK